MKLTQNIFCFLSHLFFFRKEKIEKFSISKNNIICVEVAKVL